MPRKKPTINIKAVNDWNQADKALMLIGELEMQRRVKIDRAQLRINEIREALKKECAAIDSETESYELGLKAFCLGERNEGRIKTGKDLTFGSVFFRLSHKLKTLKGVKWDDVAGRLQAKKMGRFLKITRSVKKDDLRKSKLNDEVLAELGVERRSERPFSYETNEEKFERSDGKTGATTAPAA